MAPILYSAQGWRDRAVERRLTEIAEETSGIAADPSGIRVESCIRQCVTRVQESVAAIDLQLNDRPPAIGLPGSGGFPQDHVRIKYGLGTTTYLQDDICLDSQKLHTFLQFMFSDYPGRRHIAKQHYRLFCDTNSHQPKELTQANWSDLVDSGSSIFLAFVVGTWQMSCINFCPNCNKKNSSGWRSWRSCQCGCLYFISESDETDYEPIDGFWTGEAQNLADYKDTRKLTPRNYNDHSAARPSKETVSDQPSEPAGDTPLADEFSKDSFDELYFRCMIMVYDPIFNYVCRNVFCRCILGATSFTSNAPRIEMLCALPCPNYARSGVRLKLDAVSREFVEYSKDLYFNAFGGYKPFIQTARCLN